MRTVGDLLRTSFVFVIMGVATFIYGALVLILVFFRPDTHLIDRLARSWGRLFCWTAGAKVEITGIGYIDTQKAYVVVSNHPSALDIMVHFSTLPIPIRFLAKAELFRIPLFGLVLRRMRMVRVDRQGGSKVMATINQDAANVTGRGKSLMIYPEGTRSRDGGMKKFKSGGFAIANLLSLPVLPIAVTGSDRVWKPDSLMIRSGQIKVTVMPPIAHEPRNRHQIIQQRDHVQEMIRAVVDA